MRQRAAAVAVLAVAVWLVTEQVEAQYGLPPTKGKKHRTTTTTTETPEHLNNEISGPFPLPDTGSYSASSAAASAGSQGQPATAVGGGNYWWKGPDSPFKAGDKPQGGCGGPAGCATGGPPPPAPPAPGICGGSAGCTGGSPPAESPGKPIDIAQNPFLSSAILGKPIPQSPQGCQGPGGNCQYPSAAPGVSGQPTSGYPGSPSSPGSSPYPGQAGGAPQYPSGSKPTPAGQFPGSSGSPTSQYPGSPGSPTGQYPGSSGSPTGQYPGSSGSPTGQYPGSPGSPTGQYPGSSGSPTGQYPGSSGSPTGQYPGSSGSPTGQYPGSPGSPIGQYPGSSGSPTGQYPGSPGSPTGQYPGSPGSPTSQYPGRPGSPAGQYPGGVGLPTSQYPGSSGSPAGKYPGGPGAPAGQYPGRPGSPTGQPGVPLRPQCYLDGYACVPSNMCVGGVITPNGMRQMGSPEVKECIPGLQACCRLPPGAPGTSPFSGPYTPTPGYGSVTTQKPYTGPLNTTPFPGCAAALKCVAESYCTAEGVMSDTPVSLTREQAENKVPLTDCQDPDTGIIGKCCRDPNYKDPWPAGMMMKNPGDFDDGQYHGEGSGPTVSIGPSYNAISSTPQTPSKDHGPKPSDGPGGFNKPFLQPFPGNSPTSPSYTPGKPQPSGNYQPGQPIPSGSPYQPGQPSGSPYQQGQPSGSPYQPGQPSGSPYQPGKTSGSPYQPGQPSGSPYQPGQPSGSPTQPGSPYQPGQPSPTSPSYQPGSPTQPGSPYQPGQPNLNGPSYQPGQPSGSPTQPGQPSGTYQPGQPRPSGSPYQPGQPTPTGSYQPGQPSGTPYQPGQPSGSPYQPGQPSPTDTYVPGQPAPSYQPGQPNYNLPTHPGQNEPLGPGQGEGPAPGSSCGIRRPGPSGEAAGFAEFPWQAIVVSAVNRSLLCGAAVISDNAVITAAHCVNQLAGRDLLVRAGEWKLLGQNPKPVQIRPVVAIARHPGYNSATLAKDLAILIVGQPFTFDTHVDKICIPPELDSEYFQKPGQKCVLTGWGKNALQGLKQGSDLHKVDVNVVPAKQCEAELKTSKNLGKYFILNEGFSCALPPTPSDLCKVDYGSAVACEKEDGHYELAGVNSWDIACPTNQPLPTVFATSDAQWINIVLSTATPVLQAQEDTYNQGLLKGESVDGVDIDDKPGFNQGYGK